MTDRKQELLSMAREFIMAATPGNRELKLAIECALTVLSEESFERSTKASPSDADDLWLAIKHGDLSHQAWLKEAIHAWFQGWPIPTVVMASTTPPTPPSQPSAPPATQGGPAEQGSEKIG